MQIRGTTPSDRRAVAAERRRTQGPRRTHANRNNGTTRDAFGRTMHPRLLEAPSLLPLHPPEYPEEPPAYVMPMPANPLSYGQSAPAAPLAPAYQLHPKANIGFWGKVKKAFKRKKKTHSPPPSPPPPAYGGKRKTRKHRTRMHRTRKH